jgi:hypothetical protein
MVENADPRAVVAMHVKHSLALAGILAIGACNWRLDATSWDDALISNARADAAAYFKCLQRQADELDDHKSDARTIAGAVLAACREILLADMAAIYGLNAATAEQLLRERREGDLDDATIVVLQQRAWPIGSGGAGAPLSR